MRILRESGLLPSARTRMTDGIAARFIVGMLCGKTHANAPEATLRALRATLTQFDGPDLPAPFRLGETLGEVLTKLIFQGRRTHPRPLTVVLLGINADGSGPALTIGRETGPDENWGFTNPGEPIPDEVSESGRLIYPIYLSRALDGNVINALLSMVSETVSELPPAAQHGLIAAS